MTPTTAMVLAAGLGTRMRPLTDEKPKALIEVGGRPLIDHVLDRLAEAGVTRAVVNVHAFADMMAAHLARRTDLEVVISDERAELLETAGALAKAAPLLGEDPILVANIDTLWTEEGLLARLAGAWDGARMNTLLALVPLERTLGFGGAGDFFIDAEGRLEHRGARPSAPLAYMGAHIIDPAIARAWPVARRGLIDHWLAWAGEDRLHGLVSTGRWMHVGDPAALAQAEAALSPPSRLSPGLPPEGGENASASPPPQGEGDPEGVEGAR